MGKQPPPINLKQYEGFYIIDGDFGKSYSEIKMILTGWKVADCPCHSYLFLYKTFFSNLTLSAKTSSNKGKGGSYFSRLKWVPIPVTVGFAYIGYQQYGHIKKREERKLNTASDPEELLANDWNVRYLLFLSDFHFRCNIFLKITLYAINC